MGAAYTVYRAVYGFKFMWVVRHCAGTRSRHNIASRKVFAMCADDDGMQQEQYTVLRLSVQGRFYSIG